MTMMIRAGCVRATHQGVCEWRCDRRVDKHAAGFVLTCTQPQNLGRIPHTHTLFKPSAPPTAFVFPKTKGEAQREKYEIPRKIPRNDSPGAGCSIRALEPAVPRFTPAARSASHLRRHAAEWRVHADARAGCHVEQDTRCCPCAPRYLCTSSFRRQRSPQRVGAGARSYAGEAGRAIIFTSSEAVRPPG